jgi:hypothetical protein
MLINDLRESYKVQGATSAHGTPPDLVTLRNRRALEHGLTANKGMPVPGGLGAGIEYTAGALQILNHAELSTGQCEVQSIVHAAL